jgi:putative transcriptional regulator
MRDAQNPVFPERRFKTVRPFGIQNPTPGGFMDSTSGSLKGHFLISMPALLDPNFNQTVTLMCEHNEEGALGIVVNRIHPQLTCEAIFEELEMECEPAAAALPVHVGGPVHIGQVFLIHGAPFDWEASLQITPTIAMSNSRDIVAAVARGEGPRSLLFSLGCAGWGPGQLENELRENAWLTTPALEQIVFEWPVENRWQEAVKRMGIDPALLSDTAGTA